MLIPLFIVFGVFLLVLQTTLFSSLPSWFGRPDLVYLLIVFLAYRFDTIKGAFLAFFMGLLLDVFSGVFLGIYPTIYILVFFILKILSKQIANETTYQVPLTVISYLFSASCIFITTSFLAPEMKLVWSWRALMLQIIMLAVIAIPFFFTCDAYLHFCTKKFSRLRSLSIKGSGNRFKS
jgi:rod shape-determining protein MreD